MGDKPKLEFASDGILHFPAELSQCRSDQVEHVYGNPPYAIAHALPAYPQYPAVATATYSIHEDLVNAAEYNHLHHQLFSCNGAVF